MFLFLAFLYLSTHSALLGIDFGSDFVKLSVVSHGHPFDIVLDGSAKRKHKAILGFDDGERRFGNDAKTMLVRKPGDTVQYMQRLLGKSPSSPIVQEFRDMYYPYEFVADDKRQSVRIKLGDTTFSMEELVGMSLEFAKGVAEEFIGDAKLSDCVITVPDFFSTKERRALLDAAALAGLNVLSLINENSAAALSYGIEMNYELGEKENYIFYNMGSTSTKVSVVQYSAWNKQISRKVNKTVGQVEIMAQAWDENLGGNSFDKIILEKLKTTAERDFGGKKFDDNYRVMARLKESSEKTKRVLSANKEGLVQITSLMDDQDFKTKIYRDDFLSLAKPLFSRAMKPVDDAITRSGLEKDDIEAIILMGGSTRIPRLQELLTEYLDKELRKDINTDEAATLGAVFRASNMSTTFRVRQIGLVDRNMYGVSASFLNFDEWEATQSGSMKADDLTFSKRASIFEDNSILRRRRSVSFQHDKDLFVSLYYSSDSLPAGTTAPIAVHKISGLSKAVKEAAGKDLAEPKPKVILSFALDSSGIISLLRGTATFSVNKGGKVEKEKVSLIVENLGTDVKPLSTADFKTSRGILRKYDAIDQAIRDTAQAFNDLEAYILQNRPAVRDEDDELLKVSTESERENVLSQLDAAEEWLYEQETPEKAAMDTKLSALKDLVDPMMLRMRELKIRKSGISSLRDECDGLQKSLQDLKHTKPWIPEEDIAKIYTKISNWVQWLKEKNREQKKRDLKLEPLFVIEDLEKLVQGFGEEVRKISKRPEPEKKNEKKTKKKKAKKDSEDTEKAEDLEESDDAQESTTESADDSEKAEL